MSRPTTLRRDERGAIVSLVLIAVVLAALFASVELRTSVYLVNGLSSPLAFEIGDERVSVRPDTHAVVRLRAGAHVARIVAEDGRVVDEVPFIAPRFYDAVVVNPLGAALVYLERVRYGVKPGSPPDVELHGGERIVLARDVQDPFRPPPTQLRAKRGERVRRVHLDVAPGGAQRTIAHLLQSGEGGRALALATSLHEATPTDASLRALIDLAGPSVGPSGVRAIVARERARGRSSELGESRYDEAMGALGRYDDLLAERRAAVAARPDEPATRLARVAPRDEARALFDELVAAHPADADLAIAAAEFALADDRPADALARFQVHGSSPAGVRALEVHARALARVGPPESARDFLLANLGANPDEGAARFAASLALLPGAGRGALDLLAKLGTPARVTLLAEVGAPASVDAERDRQLAAAVAFISRAATDVPGACELWDRELEDGARALVPAETRLWLSLEAARRGLSLSIDPVRSSPSLPLPMTDVLAYVAGGAEPPQLFRVRAPLRALIEVSRARSLAAAGRPVGDAEALIARLSPGESLARRLIDADARERTRLRPPR